MSFSKKCRRYINKRSHKINCLLERAGRGYDREDYHDLRLEIKKVKSFFTMLAFVTDVKKKRYLKPYKRIFKMAGKVRDAQVASALLARQRPLKWIQQYRHELKTETLLHEKEFYLAIAEGEKMDLKARTKKLKADLIKVKKGGVRNYLAEEKRKIREIINAERISIEEAHEMRKRLKAIGYMSKLIQVEMPGEVKEIEQVQEALGTWHDLRQLAARLEEEAVHVNDAQRKLHMRHLEKTINKRAAAMFGGIRRSLRKLKEEH